MKKFLSLFIIFLLSCTGVVFAVGDNTIKYHMLGANYEGSDSSFFYSFAEDTVPSRFSLISASCVTFRESAAGRDGGVVSVRQEADSGFIGHGVKNILMYEDKFLTISGDLVYANYSNLVQKHCYLDLYLTGLAGFPLYHDAACTDYAGEAEGGFVRLAATVDTAGKSFYDGNWHAFSVSFSSKMQHNTGKYVDMSGKMVHLWLRPFAGNAFSATTTYFRSSFLTECENIGIKPYVDFYLDNLAGSYSEQKSGSVTVKDIKIDKTTVENGDCVNVTYELTGKSYNNAFVKILADEQTVACGVADGSFSFVANDLMCATHLTAELVPFDDDYHYAPLKIYDFGMVGGGSHHLFAESEGKNLTYRLDVFGEIKQSEVIAALYDENRRLLYTEIVHVPKSYGKNRVVAEGAVSCENASYGVVMCWNSLSSLSPMQDMKIVHFEKGDMRTTFYVDAENGNDRNRGMEHAPVATIETAKTLVQPYLENMQEDIYVYIKGGEYRLNQPIAFTEKDSGQNGYSVIYKPWGKETPVISGGEDYKNFELFDQKKNIWRTYVGEGTIARQVYINGVRGVRARNDVVRTNYINDDGTDGPGILTNAVMDTKNYAYICDDTAYASFRNQSDIEAVYYEYWTNPRVKVQKIEINNEGKCVFYMQPVSMQMGLSSSNCAITVPMWLENAYELLNAEGEWYLDKTDGYLYYKPRPEENPETMIATIPRLERAMTVSGENVDSMVRNIRFEGLRFQMFTWLWPSNTQNSYRESQANVISGYEGDGKLTGKVEDAAVIVGNAENVDFSNCVFTKLGGAGINYRQTFRDCDLVGNHIYDISGTGINMGVASAESSQVDMYRNPVEEKYFRSRNTITNNYIHDVGIDYRSCVGIGLSWVRDSSVMYNEIYNVNYSGMHIGWGWASYAETGTGMINVDIANNYIHDTAKEYLCDSGGIYALGATGGSAENYNKIRNNYLENMRGTPAAIYPDEGSTFWEITGNVVDTRECPTIINKRYRKGHTLEWLVIHQPTIKNNYIHDNYATTDACRKFDTTTNIYEPVQHYPNGDFPEEAQNTIQMAGLKPSYLAAMGDLLQRLKITGEKELTLQKDGGAGQISVVPMGRKLQQLSGYNIRYYSTDESVAVVDANGIITAVGEGVCNVRACVFQGDRYITASVDVVVK